MDITPLFKACINTAKLQDKTLPLASDKNRILKKSKNDFLKEAHRIRDQVTLLRNLLIENRAAYMEFACHLKDSPKMTDSERDVMDEETRKILTICLQLINEFRVECRKRKPGKQFAEHLDGVIDLLMDYLRAIEVLHKQQKEYRVKRQLESYKFLKLGAGKKRQPKRVSTEAANGEEKVNGDVQISSQKRLSNTAAAVLPADDEEINNSQNMLEDEELSPEDLQMLEQENKQLYTDLQGLTDEVEQIEKNVVDIAKLQDLFAEKVILQKVDIERIANTVVGATENVKDANEQIKQAIQRNAGLRVYVLFFLLVMSFTLLFLDWYND